MIIFYIIIIIIYFYYIMKKYKEFKTNVEKVLYIMILIFIIFPLIIYYLDRYNIPSIFGYIKNINSDLWLEILINCCVAVTTTFINAAFLIHVTHEQIKTSFIDNKNLNIENQRLQNLPLLSYKITNKLSDNFLNMNLLSIIVNSNKNDNSNFLEFNIEIENIGLNSAKKIFILIESDKLIKPYFSEFTSNSNLKINDIKKSDYISLITEIGNYDFKITIYYQDIMNYWYMQEINLKTELLKNSFNEMTKIVDYKIFDEMQIYYNPIEKNTLDEKS